MLYYNNDYGGKRMKSILSILLAGLLLIGVLGGCAKDMSGENRATPAPAATATAAPETTDAAEPTDGAVNSPAATDSTADGIIDAGRDAVDGVVGAGEDAVKDIVDAGEKMVDDVTGADSTAKPASTPSATAGR